MGSVRQSREFEWRIALALWAGMGGFGALTVAKDSALRGLNVVVFAAATVLILVGLHISFLKGITKRNTLDSDMSSEYEDEMRKLIHWTFADATIEHERSRAKRQHRSLLTNYSPRFQLLVTLCLGVIIVAALVWKSMQVDSLTSEGCCGVCAASSSRRCSNRDGLLAAFARTTFAVLVPPSCGGRRISFRLRAAAFGCGDIYSGTNAAALPVNYVCLHR